MSAIADPFAGVQEATRSHRAQHGCGAHPYGNGPLLGALAAAVAARRILELGTGLGYSALWLAHGAPDAVVDTVERDARHVKLARAHVSEFGRDGHIVVHQGDFAKVVPRLDPGYDLAFCDGAAPVPSLLPLMATALRKGGLLISANLIHAGAHDYRAALFGSESWRSATVEDGETAISVKL